MPKALLNHVRGNVVAYIALFFALGGVTYAAIPDAGGVIHGCYDSTAPMNGAYPLYVIDTATQSQCPEGRGGPMTPITWNQQGTPGTPGTPASPGSPSPSAPPKSLSDSLTVAARTVAGNGKETGVFKKSAASLSQEKSATAYCPKGYPVATYPSFNQWYWQPTGFPQDNPAFAIAELFEYSEFGHYMHNVHSERVQSGRGRGATQGWTTEWLHDAPVPPEHHEWGVELEVNCMTVAASKQYVVNVNVAK